MAFIKTLKEFLTKNVIYPTTKTNAVYDDTVGRLDTFLHNTLGAEPIDDVEEELPELRDADTLGGRYTAEDLDAMPKSTAIEDYANVEPPVNDADSLGGKYTAKNIEQEFANLNSSLSNLNNWKKCEATEIPTNAKLVRIDLSLKYNSKYCFDQKIITRDFFMGFRPFALSCGPSFSCQFIIRENSITDFVAKYNENDITSQSSLSVYYTTV